MKMDESFVRNYLILMHRILLYNKLIIPSFVLENGLVILREAYYNYGRSLNLLHLIFDYNENNISTITHLYDLFRDVLMNNEPTYSIYRILKIVLRYIDITDDLDINYIIDKLYYNDFLIFYASLEILASPFITLDKAEAVKVVNAILEEGDEVNNLNIDCYRNIITKQCVLNNLIYVDEDDIREFILDFDCNTQNVILNVLDDTLYKKCLTQCIKDKQTLPNHIKTLIRR